MEEALDKIVPPSQEKKKDLDTANQIIKEIEKQGHQAMLVGSMAKDTYLRGDKDLDIFILFPKKTSRKELEEKGLEIGKRVCQAFGVEPVVHYAEHPYTKTVIKGYDVDLVPCYCLEKGEKIISSVDRSPLHTEYIQNKMREKQKNQTRLLKYFCKQIGVYGAKIKVRGFSGYLCELLVLHYGSFEKVLKAASEWQHGEKIDLEDHGKLEFDDPLVVIDPVDPERNVAAALKETNYCWFILAARQYLKHGKIPSSRGLLEGRGKFFLLEWRIGEEIEEIIWSQLERFQEKVVSQLERHEFSVIDSLIWTDCEEKAQLLLELEVWELPQVNDHEGPEVYDNQACESFIQKYGKGLVRGARVYTEKKREHRKAEDLLQELLEETPSHLEEKGSIKKDGEARESKAFQEYSEKFWKLI